MQSVSSSQSVHIQFTISLLFTFSSHSVHNQYSSQSVHIQFTISLLFTVSSHSVYSSQSVHIQFTISSQSVHNQFTLHNQFTISLLFTISLQSVYSSQSVHNQFTLHIQFTHYIQFYSSQYNQFNLHNQFGLLIASLVVADQTRKEGYMPSESMFSGPLLRLSLWRKRWHCHPHQRLGMQCSSGKRVSCSPITAHTSSP
jgi:hypothetical protein